MLAHLDLSQSHSRGIRLAKTLDITRIMAHAGIWDAVDSPVMAHSGHRGGPDLPKYEYDSVPQRAGPLELMARISREII